MKKQITSAVMAAALLVSVTACGKTESKANSLSGLAGQTLTGTVSAMSAKQLMLDTEESGTVTIPLSGDTVFQRAQPGMGGGMGGPSAEPESYAAANTYTEDTQVSGSELTSTGTDENAVLVATQGITADLDNVTITRQSDESTGGDSSSFYGVGAAALVTDGTLNISGSTITTDAAGGAGGFAYGDGTAYVSDTAITTAQDTSGGIHVAGGGTLYA